MYCVCLADANAAETAGEGDAAAGDGKVVFVEPEDHLSDVVRCSSLCCDSAFSC